MAQVESIKEEIGKLGAELAFIAAERADGVFKPGKILRKKPVSFPFLLDENRSATKAYGLYHRLAVDAFNIAHPATLVIDPKHSIRYIYRGENQLDRAPLEQVIASVKTIAAF